ncbi:MAG: hypothetical protein IPM34_08810 [Saprospiraceae bacterium]|nr:hypothetical protein [Saprospiraceae bacterium]
MQNQLQRKLWMVATILAPVLLAISQFYWVNGVLTSTAGALQVLSFLFWIFAFQGMFHQIQDDYPRYAVWGFFLAVYGCLAGNNFGVDGIFIDAFKELFPDATEKFNGKTGTGALIAFFLPGALAPLSWTVLGGLFFIKKKIPKWNALALIIAGIGFPLSRIPRIDWLAHMDNALLLISMIGIVISFYKNKE